jgi:hypothetical protein
MRRPRSSSLAVLAVALATMTLAALAPVGGRVPAAAAGAEKSIHEAGDFNDDGFADLAIGVPGEDVGTEVNAGAVNILYGSSGGLSAGGAQLFRQGKGGILGSPHAGDQFGYAIATGDFDGDGFADLAIGVPGEAVSGHTGAGAVETIYGSAGGLQSDGNQLWSQDSAGIDGQAASGDSFGLSLAAGGLNGDGFVDLAVGVPGDAVGGRTNAGAANVLYGSGMGLSATGDQLWSQDSAGILNAAETNDNFGFAVAVGDFDGDGVADLAAGAPLEDPPSDSGTVNVIYGSNGGLTSTGNQAWSQESSGILDAGEGEDLFGFSLAAGDLDGDGRDDLAIGVPGEDVDGRLDAGGMNVIYGSGGGLASSGNQFWSQDSAGLLNASEDGDEFGLALAVGDFNGGGVDDVAVGVPFEDPPTDAGSVAVIYGSGGGLSSSGNQIWSQNSAGIKGTANEQDAFGASLAASNFDGDGFDDLAVGVPQEAVGQSVSAGSVNVIYGSAAKLVSTGNQSLSQSTAGVNGIAEDADFFGAALGSGTVATSGRSRPRGGSRSP